ncbi:MAG: class I SAM-dependent methyltransferase [Acidobacteriota bacterium]
MNADPLARVYRWVEYAAFGRALERCRFVHLGALAGARRVLVLGEGDGRFVARLLRENHGARVEVVESSGEMVRVARARVGEDARVVWHRMDAVRGPLPEGPFDAVVTHFFLDCFSGAEAAVVVREAARRLEAGGVWVISEFCDGGRGWRGIHARAWLWVMYRFFWLTTGLRVRRLPGWQGMLEEAGLRREKRQLWRWGLLTAEVWRKGG